MESGGQVNMAGGAPPLPLKSRERQLGVIRLSPWFILLLLMFPLTVPAAAHKECVPGDGGGGGRAGHGLCTTQPGCVIELHAWECTVFAGPWKGLMLRSVSCAQKGVDYKP